jgi:cation diffusion facilitator CzcD-associated flavoprotein CzcO
MREADPFPAAAPTRAFVTVAVIGAGQAGLAVGYHLKEAPRRQVDGLAS